MSVRKTFSVELDMKQPASTQEFEVVEGDNGNVIRVTLKDNGVDVDLTGCRVIAVFAKTDGTVTEQDTDGHGVTVVENVITIDLYTGSVLPGMVRCEVQVYSGEEHDTLATSAQFNFQCRKAITNEETLRSTNDYPILMSLIERVRAIVERAQSNWAESDTTSPAYIANKPDILESAEAVLESVPAVDAIADGDKLIIDDVSAAAGSKVKHITWSAIKTLLASVFAPLLHASRHAAGGADAITPTAIGAESARLQFNGTIVPASSFVEDSTYSDYGFRAAVQLTGVLATMTPEVTLSLSDATSGNFAPVCACYDGGVYLYASAVPDAAITIPTIICWKAVG